MYIRQLYMILPREDRHPLVVVTTIHGQAPKEPPQGGAPKARRPKGGVR